MPFPIWLRNSRELSLEIQIENETTLKKSLSDLGLRVSSSDTVRLTDLNQAMIPSLEECRTPNVLDLTEVSRTGEVMLVWIKAF